VNRFHGVKPDTLTCQLPDGKRRAYVAFPNWKSTILLSAACNDEALAENLACNAQQRLVYAANKTDPGAVSVWHALLIAIDRAHGCLLGRWN
jgi:hypothetical protein